MFFSQSYNYKFIILNKFISNAKLSKFSSYIWLKNHRGFHIHSSLRSWSILYWSGSFQYWLLKNSFLSSLACISLSFSSLFSSSSFSSFNYWDGSSLFLAEFLCFIILCLNSPCLSILSSIYSWLSLSEVLLYLLD